MHDEQCPEPRFRDLRLFRLPFWLWVVVAYGTSGGFIWWLF